MKFAAVSILAVLLGGCGTVATVASVTGTVVGAAVTVTEVAVDGAVAVGHGAVKTGEILVDAASSSPPPPARR